MQNHLLLNEAKIQELKEDQKVKGKNVTYKNLENGEISEVFIPVNKRLSKKEAGELFLIDVKVLDVEATEK